MSGAPRYGWRLALIAAAVVAIGVPASVIARVVIFPPTFPVTSIRQTPSYQDPALLDRAWTLPAARAARHTFAYQSNGSRCGPSSLANVFRSIGQEADEKTVLAGSGKCWTGICFGGLTLDELAEMARKKTPRKVEVLRDLTYAEFEEHMHRSNDPERRYVINFQRGLLYGKGLGHHSPIGGYLEPENLVFVLDVNRDYQPFLVDAQRLFEAMNTVDSDGGKKRGLLVVGVGATPPASNVGTWPEASTR